jgi:hypothetical protein
MISQTLRIVANFERRSDRLASICLWCALLWLCSQGADLLLASEGAFGKNPGSAGGIWAEIRVVDATTGRGVPLAELETVNGLKFVTDNAGRVAVHEPGLMGAEIFFTVRSHGYEMPRDAFGFAGARILLRSGKAQVIKLSRRNVAERLCRLTGEGLYRDSILLGYKVPRALNGRVAGQDSVQAAVYRGRVYWFWGDTLQMIYPLGLFRMAGARTPLPDAKDTASDPAVGMQFEYFVDKQTGFARAMMPLPERPEGVVWVSAVCTVPDERGVEKLIGHYSRRKGLESEYEHGIAVFNDDKLVFEPVKQLPLTETWRRPSGHPVIYNEGGTKWLLFGSPTPNVRVPATLKDVLDPARYDAFTCARAANRGKPAGPIVAAGKPVWRWQKELSPLGSKTEQEWVKQGKIKPEHARFCPTDAARPEDRIVLHSGSVRWNAYRKRWLLIAGQAGGKASFLGEVWYAEALHPTGSFAKAVRIVTHDRQTFYNVCHHAFLDRDGGRVIHFEGTYTNDFSGNPEKTPRYNYNQILYRLDVAADELSAAREE